MKNGTLLVVLALALYLGFEAYAIRKAAHRIEPAYIHNMLVEANTAERLCSYADESLRKDFDRTLERVIQRYRDDLSEKNPDSGSQFIDQSLEEATSNAISRVEEFLQQNSCSHQEIKDHLQRFKIYAAKSW